MQASTEVGAKANGAVEQLLELWESGQLPRLVEKSVIRRQSPVQPRPSDRWSLCNVILMLLQGTDDAASN